MENTPNDYAHIKGWGIDADPKNDPTYPMRKRSAETVKGYSWKRPPLQPVDMEVLHSIERPNVSAVYGNSVPPSGLSGIIRRFAFKYSENRYRHWLPLILADRINVVEGLVEDLTKGHLPNIFAEKGMKADLEHNRSGLVARAAIGLALVGAVVAIIATTGNSKKK